MTCLVLMPSCQKLRVIMMPTLSELGGTAGCLYDNLQCHRFWQSSISCHHDNVWFPVKYRVQPWQTLNWSVLNHTVRKISTGSTFVTVCGSIDHSRKMMLQAAITRIRFPVNVNIGFPMLPASFSMPAANLWQYWGIEQTIKSSSCREYSQIFTS